jgi:hypothetical protein
MRPRPNRGRILRAIELTRNDRGEALVVQDIATDAVFILIRWIDYRRDKREDTGDTSYALYDLVKESTQFFGFDPGRCRVYNLVIMRYYSLLSQLTARARRIQKGQQAVSKKALAAA